MPSNLTVSLTQNSEANHPKGHVIELVSYSVIQCVQTNEIKARGQQ